MVSKLDIQELKQEIAEHFLQKIYKAAPPGEPPTLDFEAYFPDVAKYIEKKLRTRCVIRGGGHPEKESPPSISRGSMSSSGFDPNTHVLSIKIQEPNETVARFNRKTTIADATVNFGQPRRNPEGSRPFPDAGLLRRLGERLRPGGPPDRRSTA